MARCNNRFTIDQSVYNKHRSTLPAICSTSGEKVKCSWKEAKKNKVPRDLYCELQTKATKLGLFTDSRTNPDFKRTITKLDKEYVRTLQKIRRLTEEIDNLKEKRKQAQKVKAKLESNNANLKKDFEQHKSEASNALTLTGKKLKTHYDKLYEKRRKQGREIVDKWYDRVAALPSYKLGEREYIAELYKVYSFDSDSTPTTMLWIRDVPLIREKIRNWKHDNNFKAFYDRGIQIKVGTAVNNAEKWLEDHIHELHIIMSSCALRAIFDEEYERTLTQTACDNELWPSRHVVATSE